MTGTLKTNTALNTAIGTTFPDGHDGAITPAVARQWFEDHVRSAGGCYGCMKINAGSTQFTLVAATFQDIASAGWASVGSLDLTLSTSAGTITIPTSGDGPYDVSADVTIQRDTVVGGAGSHLFYVKLVKNGSEVVTRSVSIGTDAHHGTISLRLQGLALVAADVLKLQIAQFTGGLGTVIGADFSVARRLSA